MNSKTIKQGLDQIASIDADVKKGLDLVGYPEPRIRPEGFESLLAIILGQQISTEAASSIRKQLDRIWSEKTAGSFLRFTEETLPGIGFSRRKIEYSKGIALAIEDGELEMDQFSQKTDQEAKSQLVKISSFGEWSAEIYLVFSLGRTDIFPANDLALQESLKRLKQLKDRPNENESRKLVSHWSPWRSVGGLFLWKYYRGAPDQRDE